MSVLSDDLSALRSMAYPGRVIIIGRVPSGRHDVVIYAVTGRSSSSRARRLIHDGGGTVRTEVTDPGLLIGGNEKLLLYRCLRPFPGGLVVSNGAQTDLIAETAWRLAQERAAYMDGEPPPKRGPLSSDGEDLSYVSLFPLSMTILTKALLHSYHISGVDVTTYEPDAPAFTPRISGCLADTATLTIARRMPDGEPRQQYYSIPLIPGRGDLLATYRGENRDPLPTFEGEPQPVGLTKETPQEMAEAVFEALGPKETLSRATGSKSAGPDLRVGVAVVFRNRETGEPHVAIINRTEEGP